MEMKMANRIKDLIDEFVDEKENGFCEVVYEKFYAYLADSFHEAVHELCKIIIFGREYSLTTQELYSYDRHVAGEAWYDHVSQQFGDFRDWMDQVISDELDEFIDEFQKWLSEQDDEWASDAIVALMGGDIDITEIVADWLYDRLRNEDWDYPA